MGTGVAEDSPQPSATHATSTPQAPSRAPRCTGPFSVMAQPGDRACVAYNQGLCSCNPIQLTSMCAATPFILSRGSVNTHSFTASERFSQKTGLGGLKQLTPPREDNPTSTACQTLQQATGGAGIFLTLQHNGYHATPPT